MFVLKVASRVVGVQYRGVRHGVVRRVIPMESRLYAWGIVATCQFATLCWGLAASSGWFGDHELGISCNGAVSFAAANEIQNR